MSAAHRNSPPNASCMRPYVLMSMCNVRVSIYAQCLKSGRWSRPPLSFRDISSTQCVARDPIRASVRNSALLPNIQRPLMSEEEMCMRGEEKALLCIPLH
ncbi:unnamed protein product [Cercopithifilaria johnstoni]|uniref:Uncharacterized protein n=1 Tax=Cercopithifilaria johnstoni TaxID=2874296 RepID=A0A8J2M2Z2_9BILA|nr:unnamed protein product [Cercopithifilaria johnstoni]